MQEKLPVVEHRVSRLQRKFQTLKMINPSLCESTTISEALSQLMNDLQVLQGRLEVIPEESDLQTPRRDFERWQEKMRVAPADVTTKVGQGSLQSSAILLIIYNFAYY